MTDDEREATVVQRLAKVRQDTVAALAMFRVAAALGEDTDAYRDTVYEPLLTLSQHDVVRLVVLVVADDPAVAAMTRRMLAEYQSLVTS